MEKRLGKIEILGTEYPLNFSVRIAQQYNDLAGEKLTGFGADRRAIELLSLLLEEGAAYCRLVLGKEIVPPSLEQLELIFTPADTPRIAVAIREALELGGMRMVAAKSSKKNEGKG